MIKLAANAALMTRISFINEIANVCEAIGADVVKVAEGIGLRPAHRAVLPARRVWDTVARCFPKDSLALKQLASNSGYHFQLLAAVIEVNELQKRRVIGKLERHLGSLRGKKVALLGLAFKPNTDDMREAPSIVLAGRLSRRARRCVAGIRSPTEACCRGRSRSSPTVADAVRGADAAVIVTEWPELKSLASAGDRATLMANPLIIDGRNLLDPDAYGPPGFVYEGIGRPTSSDVVESRLVQWRRSSSAAGRPSGSATPPAAGRSRSSRSAGGRSPPTRSRGSRKAGVERVIMARAPSGQGELFERELAGLGPEVVAAEEPERLGRGGGIRFAAQRAARERRRLRAERRRARRRRLRRRCSSATARQAPPRPSRSRSRARRSASSTSATATRSPGSARAAAIPYWVSCGIYVLSTEALERFPERGDHETTTFPELVRGGAPAAPTATRALADRQHAEGAARRRPTTSRRTRSGWREDRRRAAAARRPWAFETRRVEKPWGYELIWALTDIYCGKLLFVKAGHSLSLQYHEREGRVVADPVRARADRARRGRPGLARGGGRRRRRRASTTCRARCTGITAVEDTTILEVSTPHLDDVVRLADSYGRA